eukprot:TRINITY_DN1934_c0_g1_i1.p1 TRINITY_DN1934_c0_g1~~TRINITY_DN1934_c0_g1_i1.p1  ORF type:complete len:185 (+),score=41.71 TRINITY_DN1934_c0_g1_i1:518-1072(+)
MKNLTQRSRIWMDNAKYHKTYHKLDFNLKQATKQQMQEWARNNGIPIPVKILKEELKRLLEGFCPKPRLEVEVLAAKYGHKIVWGVPYHSLWNPIEKGWGQMKNHVALHNSGNKENLMGLLREARAKVKPETWEAIFKRVRKEISEAWEHMTVNAEWETMFEGFELEQNDNSDEEGGSGDEENE